MIESMSFAEHRALHVLLFLRCISVMDGVLHFTCNRPIAVCLLKKNSDSMTFGAKSDGGLTRYDSKVLLITYC